MQHNETKRITAHSRIDGRYWRIHVHVQLHNTTIMSFNVRSGERHKPYMHTRQEPHHGSPSDEACAVKSFCFQANR